MPGSSAGSCSRVSVTGPRRGDGKLNLQLGFSHPVVYEMPAGVEVATPSQTEIVVSGADKQAVGQAAAEIRAFRPSRALQGQGRSLRG